MTAYTQGFKYSLHNSNAYSSWVWDLTIIVGLLSIFYFFGLGSYPLFTPDEGRYSEVAREMMVSGDFITPRLNGVVFLDKPILYYWLQASAIKCFGLNEWALRFWPAVIGIWGCFIMYISSRLLFNRRTGFLATLILAINPLYFGAAHYANLDLEVAVFISSALFCFLLGIQSTHPLFSRLSIYAAYFFSGLAVLTKGLIGLAFPILIIGTWVVLSTRWNTIKKLRPLSGLIILLAMTLPWYILAQKANPEFFHFFFIVQQISRFLSTNDFNNQVPGWFYFPIVFAGFLPWSILLLNVITTHMKHLWQNYKGHNTNLYLLLWLCIIFTFFSIPHSKTIGYILPIFPALSLLTGQYLDQHWQSFFATRKKLKALLFPLLFALFATACLIVPSVKRLEVSSDLFPYLKGAGIDFLITTVVLIYFVIKKNFFHVWNSIVVSSVVFLFILVNSAHLINQNSTKPLALQIKHTLTADDEIVTFYKYFQDLPIYLERRITIVADWNDPNISHNDNWLRELWYGMSFQDTKPWLINEDTFWQRWNSNKRLYVLTNIKYYDTFKAKAKERFYLAGQYNETVLITNLPG